LNDHVGQEKAGLELSNRKEENFLENVKAIVLSLYWKKREISSRGKKTA